MLRRIASALLLAVTLACLVGACSTQSCPDAGSSPHTFGWAPIGAVQTSYVGYATAGATIKASPATLLSVYAVNRNVAARYLQLFDANSGQDAGVLTDAGVPASSAVPAFQFYLPASSGTTVQLFPPGGQSFVNGVAFGVSTTAGTYTAATAADHDVEAVYQ